jgi:hypothetical protein
LNDRNKVAVMVKFMSPSNSNATNQQRAPDKIGLAPACECLFGNLSETIGGGGSRVKSNSGVCGER